MAALYAKGIENCIIEVNAPEFPILDGSAKAYIDAINEVGIVEQEQAAEPYIVKQRHEVISEDGKSRIILLPDSHFGIDVHVSFDSPVLDNQFASLERLQDFDTEIASSRTFVFVREVEMLLQHNLIKGGDLDNALVIYDEPMSQEKLDSICDLVGVPHKKDPWAISITLLSSSPMSLLVTSYSMY